MIHLLFSLSGNIIQYFLSFFLSFKLPMNITKLGRFNYFFGTDFRIFKFKAKQKNSQMLSSLIRLLSSTELINANETKEKCFKSEQRVSG